MKTKKTFKMLSMLLMASILMTSCYKDEPFGITGQGGMVTENIYMESVDGIELKLDGNVVLSQGDVQKISIVAQENILDNIEHEFENGIYELEFDRRVRHHDGVTVYITLAEITKLAIRGSGEISGTDKIECDDLKLKISGSGDIKLDVDANFINTRISGSGHTYLSGSTYSQEIDISGSGEYHAFSLESNNADVKISGSGDVNVAAQKNLDVKISGSGDVYFIGYPTIDLDISGSGNLRSAN